MGASICNLEVFHNSCHNCNNPIQTRKVTSKGVTIADFPRNHVSANDQEEAVCGSNNESRCANVELPGSIADSDGCPSLDGQCNRMSIIGQV